MAGPTGRGDGTPEINILAVLVGTIAAFVLGALYYGALGAQLAKVSSAAAAAEPPRLWQMGAELLRCLVLTVVLAGLASAAGTENVAEGLLLGLALWVGFPLVLWTGAMLHEKEPWRLAAIHAGDWLVKLLVVSVIVSVWR